MKSIEEQIVDKEAELEQLRLKASSVKNFEPTLPNIIEIVKQVCNECQGGGDYQIERGGDYLSFDDDGNFFTILGGKWRFEVVERRGGYEGCGEEHWIAFKVFSSNDFSNDLTYWEIPGYYASYEGGNLEYDDIFQVKPKEKTITVYEKIN